MKVKLASIRQYVMANKKWNYGGSGHLFGWVCALISSSEVSYIQIRDFQNHLMTLFSSFCLQAMLCPTKGRCTRLWYVSAWHCSLSQLLRTSVSRRVLFFVPSLGLSHTELRCLSDIIVKWVFDNFNFNEAFSQKQKHN